MIGWRTFIQVCRFHRKGTRGATREKNPAANKIDGQVSQIFGAELSSKKVLLVGKFPSFVVCNFLSGHLISQEGKPYML